MPSGGEIHGKGAIIYISATSTVAAGPLAQQLEWSIEFEQQLVDTTPLNNTWKAFVKGLMGWTGTFAGNLDTASKTLWTASTDTLPQKFYLYPLGANGLTQYYQGSAWIQLGKIAAGSTTTKAGNSFKCTGDGTLSIAP